MKEPEPRTDPIDPKSVGAVPKIPYPAAAEPAFRIIREEPFSVSGWTGVQVVGTVGIGEIVDVVARALEVFGDRTKALRWLRTPIPSLGDSTPQEMLEREGGIEQVEDVLGRIEHGVW